jgi:hypothetical protein
MSEETKALVDTSSIDTEITGLASQVLEESDPEKAKQLIALFNWNISKKNTARILKMNDLYDEVTDQMVLRFKTKADQFSNSDLLDYMKAVQGAIDTSTKNLSQVEEPPTIVHQTNTQINVNVVDTFDRDSKDRILAAIQATLKAAQQPQPVQQEPDVIEVTAEEVVVTDVPLTEAVADNAIEELNSIADDKKETNA